MYEHTDANCGPLLADGRAITGSLGQDDVEGVRFIYPHQTLGPPGMVRDFGVVVRGSRVTLYWREPGSGYPPTGYLIEAGSTRGASNLASLRRTETIFDAQPVDPGRYFVRVTAYNDAGNGPPTPDEEVVVGGLFGSITDPSGDVAPGSPDLVSAIVAVNGPNLELTVRFTPGTFDRTPPASGPGGTRVQFSLDTDENQATGHRGTDAACIGDNGVLGTDFIVNFGPGDDGGIRGRVFRFLGPNCNRFAAVGSTAPGSVVLGTDSMQLVVPLAMIGNDDGRLAFKVSSSRALGGGGFTGILDRMTNPGLPPGRVPNP